VNGTLFLTGGTGFLGMALLARLLEDEVGPDVFVAVRAADDAGARERLADTLAQLYDNPPASAARLRPVRADLTERGLGIAARDLGEITREADRVVHCAASISFDLPLGDARAINVCGTARVLELARSLDRLERVVHVSTAYVSGRSAGPFGEDDLDNGQGFRNTYEQTKLEAERYLAASAGDLPLAVVRPSIVVGESDSGWTSAFNVVYFPMQAFARGLLREVPADPAGVVDLVPVDHVVDVIEAAAFAPQARGVFNAVAGDQALLVEELVDRGCALMGREPPHLTEPGSLDLGPGAASFAPYFDVKTRFDDTRTRTVLGLEAPPARDYLAPMLAYAQAARWGKRRLTREAARRELEPAARR
jgi:long-chain acyl-CoA synthetase